ncbi:MAG: AAA family ATPase [Cyanobacteria bacterium P01_A01_bin.114]
MLTSVRIQNYRCLKDVTLELGPLTVFVGPNASGKTAIADSLTTSRVAVSDHWLQSEQNRPTWTIASNLVAQSPDPNKVLGDGTNRQKYTFDLSDLRQGQTANESWTLDGTGKTLANLFDTLSRRDQEKFVSEFTRLVPMYSDIKARAQGGRKRLQFQDRWHLDSWYEPNQVSDGTILIAAIIALGFQRTPPTLAVIEDPDYGLHPYLQRHVVTILRDLAEGKLGIKPVQVVCTTHSRALLDYLKPEEVRFVTRNRDNGETEVHKAPLDNPNWQQVYERFQKSLGNMWMTGTLGGVPGG